MFWVAETYRMRIRKHLRVAETCLQICILIFKNCMVPPRDFFLSNPICILYPTSPQNIVLPSRPSRIRWRSTIETMCSNFCNAKREIRSNSCSVSFRPAAGVVSTYIQRTKQSLYLLPALKSSSRQFWMKAFCWEMNLPSNTSCLWYRIVTLDRGGPFYTKCNLILRQSGSGLHFFLVYDFIPCNT